MSPAEIQRLFQLDEKQKLDQEQAVNLRRLIFLGYKGITYEEAKKVLLEVIAKFGKDQARTWYLQKVYDLITAKSGEEELRTRTLSRARKNFKDGRY